MVRVLRVAVAASSALALLGAAPSVGPVPASPSPTTSRTIDLTPRPRGQIPGRPPIDWERVRRNTAEYEKALARHNAALEPAEHGLWPKRLLDTAQKLAPVPSMWDRVMPSSAPTAQERAALALVDHEVALAQRFIDMGANNSRIRLDALEESFKTAKHKDVLLQRVKAERALLEERIQVANELADAARARLHEMDGTAWGRVKEYVHKQTFTDAPTEIVRLRAQLARWQATPKAPILSADLSYVKGDLTSGAPVQGQAVPAYSSGSTNVGLEDTTQGREVELSADIVAKAQELATPVAAYDFVKNDVKLDWYYGALKGSTEILREKRGNDADLASLLIALLRAQGHPARYVRGTVQLPIARVADLMGLLSDADLQQIYVPGSTYVLPAATRNLVLQGLTAAGIPYQPIQSGGQVAAVQLTHVWVEAFIGYADYRGAGDGVEGKQWVPIDPGIPGVGKYAASAPALDALAAMNKTAPDLTAAFLAQNSSQTAMEFIRGQVQAWLAQNRPELTYAQLLRAVVQKPERLSFIPGTLPYKVVSVQDELPFLPDDFKHRVHITVSDATGPVLDTTLPMHQMLGHRSTLTYEPATEADQEAVWSSGGLYNAPASVVQVNSVVRVDGVDKAVATRAVGLGVDQTWTLELLLPNGSSKRIQNNLIAGNLVALGFGGPQNQFTEPATHVDSDQDGDAPVFMYGRTVAYANAWTASEEELGQLLGVVPLRPTASVVFVENQLEAQQTLGIVQQVAWKGLEVDADLRTMTPLELAAGRGSALLRLSGYEGSSQEAKVLTDGTGEAAVSAVTVIQTANASALPVLDITAANQATVLPTLTADPAVIVDVVDQLARGREVRIPQVPQTIENWTGTGYIATNPTTQEAGYFLSGIVSGGQTVVSPQFWTDTKLVEKLKQPGAPKPIDDKSKIARIIKIEATDMQESTVGVPCSEPLQVYVTTMDGVPVSNAHVIFLIPSGVGATPIFASAADATTGPDGIAKVTVAPDTKILDDYIARLPRLPGGPPDPTKPNMQLYGWNSISATTDNGTDTIVLAKPFHVIGLPDAPARVVIEETVGPQWALAGLEVGIPYKAWITDWFDNPRANDNVTWTQETCVESGLPPPPGQPCWEVGAAKGAFIVESLRGSGIAILSPGDPPVDPSQKRSLSLQSDTLGAVATGYIAPWLGNGVHGVQVSARLNALAGYYFIMDYEPDRGTSSFSVRSQPRPNWDGIKGTAFPAAFTAQVMVYGDSGWAPFNFASTTFPDSRGGQSDIVSSDMQMRVVDSGGITLSSDTVNPPGDTWIFHPRYLADGRQTVQFWADVNVNDSGAAGPRRACCDAAPAWIANSGTPTADAWRQLLGGASTSAGAGPASTGDEKVGFKVINPGSEPLWAEVSLVPTDIVALPGADVLQRGPRATDNYMRIPPQGAFNLLFPVKLGTPAGEVSIVLRALDFDLPPSSPCGVGGGSLDLLLPASPDGSGRTCLRAVLPDKPPVGRKRILPVKRPATALVATISPRAYSWDQLAAGQVRVTIDYRTSGYFDEVDWSIENVMGRVYKTTTPQTPATGLVAWDGLDDNGVTIPPGDYRAVLTGKVGGTTTNPVSVEFSVIMYKFTGPPVSAGEGTEEPSAPGRYVLVNCDDDNLNGISDLGEYGLATPDHDIIELNLELKPSADAALDLDSEWAGKETGSKRPTKLWADWAKTQEIMLPATWGVGEAPPQVYLEGIEAGQETFTAQARTASGETLPNRKYVVTVIKAEFVEDTDGDHRISAAEVEDSGILAVEPLLFDYPHAFDGDDPVETHPIPNGTLVYTGVANRSDATGGEPWNFIGGDSKRFYIRVEDPTSVAQAGSVAWYTTLGADPAQDDDLPSDPRLSLHGTELNSVLASVAIGLVTEDVDATVATNDGWGVLASRGARDHRLRKISGAPTRDSKVDNRVVGRYEPLAGQGQKLEWSIPVFRRSPAERRVVYVHIFNYAQPFKFIGPTDVAFIQGFKNDIVSRFAAIGIQVVAAFDPVADLIEVPDLIRPGEAGWTEEKDYSIAVLTKRNVDLPGGYHEPSYERMQLIEMAWQKCKVDDPHGLNTICLIVVPGLYDCGETYAAGIEVPPSSHSAGFSFVSSMPDACLDAPYTAAHEVGHNLLTYVGSSIADAEYSGPNAQYNLMYPISLRRAKSITSAKRLWAPQRDAAFLSSWAEILP